MKNSDKFLIGIVTGIVILVIAVLAIALLRPNQPAYQVDDTAEGVAHNYLLALQLEDYERAYAYLSPALPGYPEDAETFEKNVVEKPWHFGGSYADNVSLAIEAANVTGNQARIIARKTVFYRAGLFDSGQSSNTFNMSLRQEGGDWKVMESDDYWTDCWESYAGCQ